jgi:leucyl aminopeptidase
MTAWVKKGTREEVGIITDFVDPEYALVLFPSLPKLIHLLLASSLTEFITTLIDKYLDIPWVATKCGYACSDHASWTQAGYPGAFGIESSFENSNKNIHSVQE